MESSKEISPEEDIKLKTAKVIIDRLLTFKDISFIDPFDILNISYNSTDEQIKRKYRSTAIQIHPDKCHLPQAGDAFNILENAYNFLTSPKTKYNFINILSSAKERVNIIRKERNEERTKKKLPLLPNDTLDDEIREMIRKINKENEENEIDVNNFNINDLIERPRIASVPKYQLNYFTSKKDEMELDLDSDEEESTQIINFQYNGINKK